MTARSSTRSRSAPPAQTDVHRTALNQDEEPLSPFPAFIDEDDDAEDAHVPTWLRELTMTRVGRHSRASSVISTRTRFSTTTMDEVRSIEISAGGQTFRISRDGSQVTDTTAPPPYTDSSSVNESEGGDSAVHDEALSEAGDIEADDQEEPHEDVQTKSRGKRVRILMPGQDDDDEGEEQRGEASTRAGHARGPINEVLTRADLYQLLLDLPFQLKRVLGLRPFGQFRQPARDGSAQPQVNASSKPTRPTSSQSLPDSFMLHNSAGDETAGIEVAGRQPREAQVPDPLHDQSRPGQEEHDLSIPLTVMDLNELSLVYNRVIKDLDREHRKQLHERDKELAELRFLLNEKDVIYRQQLKGKDFVIDDLRKRLEHNEDTLDNQLERARFEVEDLWEKRWKERDRHLMDRMRRIEEAMKVTGQNAEGEQLARQPH